MTDKLPFSSSRRAAEVLEVLAQRNQFIVDFKKAATDGTFEQTTLTRMSIYASASWLRPGEKSLGAFVLVAECYDQPDSYFLRAVGSGIWVSSVVNMLREKSRAVEMIRLDKADIAFVEGSRCAAGIIGTEHLNTFEEVMRQLYDMEPADKLITIHIKRDSHVL